MNNKPKKINKTKTNLIYDIVIFFVFLVSYDPEITGVALHEWMGVAFAGSIIVHLLLHWKWIVQITKRLFSRLPDKTRMNYFLNLLLLVDVAGITFTGFMISGTVLPVFGMRAPRTEFWLDLHEFFAGAGAALIGSHLALHWKWLLNAGKRFILSPLDLVGAAPKPRPQYQNIQQKEI